MIDQQELFEILASIPEPPPEIAERIALFMYCPLWDACCNAAAKSASPYRHCVATGDCCGWIPDYVGIYGHAKCVEKTGNYYPTKDPKNIQIVADGLRQGMTYKAIAPLVGISATSIKAIAVQNGLRRAG